MVGLELARQQAKRDSGSSSLPGNDELDIIPVWLHDEPAMLRPAMRHLLENAIRYTARDGNITAGIGNGGAFVWFWVNGGTQCHGGRFAAFD